MSKALTPEQKRMRKLKTLYEECRADKDKFFLKYGHDADVARIFDRQIERFRSEIEALQRIMKDSQSSGVSFNSRPGIK